jgi:hypothetical protein
MPIQLQKVCNLRDVAPGVLLKHLLRNLLYQRKAVDGPTLDWRLVTDYSYYVIPFLHPLFEAEMKRNVLTSEEVAV